MKNVKEISNYLYQTARTSAGKETFSQVLELYDNPQNNFEVIHIVGTNGKGSTANFLSDIFKSKYKIGTFTSPSLLVINDRIKLNQEIMSEEEFVKYYNLVFDDAEKYLLGFFEVLTLISLLYFRDQNIEYAVYESGIGGKRDCTSLLGAKTLILTSVGFDHVEMLGNTLEKICEEKVAALNLNGTLITHNFCDSVNLVIQENVKCKNAKLIIAKSCKLDLNMLGDHQQNNANLAIETAKLYGFEEEEAKIIVKNSCWKGRFECIGSEVYVDGAHNIEGLETAINTAITKFGKNNFTILASFLREKDLDELYAILKKGTSNIQLTTFDYRRALSFEELENLKYPSSVNYVDFVNDYLESGEKLLVTGSLYFVSALLKDLKEQGKYE